jgi:hypothetical protein
MEGEGAAMNSKGGYSGYRTKCTQFFTFSLALPSVFGWGGKKKGKTGDFYYYSSLL